MSTFGTMIDRVCDELARSDLSAYARTSIKTAIDEFKDEPFFFLERSAGFATVADQEYASAGNLSDIANIQSILSMRLSVDGGRYLLTPQPFQWIDEVNTNAAYTGDPTDYAVWGKEIRFYPIPNASRNVTMSYYRLYDALSATADTNPWMVEGEMLIRTTAKVDLLRHVIRGDGHKEADILELQKARMLQILRGASTRRQSTGRVMPTQF